MREHDERLNDPEYLASLGKQIYAVDTGYLVNAIDNAVDKIKAAELRAMELGDHARKSQKVAREMRGLLAGAMVALGRQGWEDGPTDSEVKDRIWDFLDADNEISGTDTEQGGGDELLKQWWEGR